MGKNSNRLATHISETDHVAVLMARAEIAAANAAGIGRKNLQRMDRQLSSGLQQGRSGLAAGWWLTPVAMVASIAWLVLIRGVLN